MRGGNIASGHSWTVADVWGREKWSRQKRSAGSRKRQPAIDQLSRNSKKKEEWVESGAADAAPSTDIS